MNVVLLSLKKEKEKKENGVLLTCEYLSYGVPDLA